MDTLPLPPRPSVEQYRKRAKDLVAAVASTDPGAVRAWATEWLAALARLLGVVVTPFVQHSFDRAVETLERDVAVAAGGGAFKFADAQRLIARAHGFESWTRFVRHIEELTTAQAGDADFEAAVDAVVSGDLDKLTTLLEGRRDLLKARSSRVHRATLLHYVAANGVEDFRQVTPPNAVDVACLLLSSGSEVDALAETYGGGLAQTTMNLLVSSTHPADAGLQPALVETLLDHGAAIDGLEDDGSPLMTAITFGHRDAAETLARRGARIDTVLLAAALGRDDLVRQFVVGPRTLAPGVPMRAAEWLHVPKDPRVHIELALVLACKFNRPAVARILLEKGVDPAARDSDQMTALHWASASGALDIMSWLLKRVTPLEVRNTWGGTVLDSTVYFAMHQPMRGADYPAVIEALVAAGADVREVSPFPTGIEEIDAILRRAGAG